MLNKLKSFIDLFEYDWLIFYKKKEKNKPVKKTVFNRLNWKINFLKKFKNLSTVVDLVVLGCYRFFYFFKNNNFFSRQQFRLKNTKMYFYNVYKNNYKLFSGLSYFFKALKYWFIAFILTSIVVYGFLILKLNFFSKTIFIWVVLGMFFYWLLSGFVFFFKKYQFGKYTTAIQRFWRRSYIIFWILEAFLFCIFFYLTVNASAESFYMFDQIQIYKTHLFSFRFFLLKILPLSFLILISYFTLLNLKFSTFYKNLFVLLIITFILTYVIWLEYYQFYHILNYYNNVVYTYEVSEHSWLLDTEIRRTRLVNHYTSLLLILKFWHIVFIYFFWIFFLLRVIEFKKIKYPLFAANFQNFIILYLFAWVYMYPWLKYYFRKFLDISYYYFYNNPKQNFIKIFFYDIFNIFYHFFLNSLNNFKKINFVFFDYFYYFNTQQSFFKNLVISNV